MAGLLGSLIEKISGTKEDQSTGVEENELPSPKDVEAMLEYQAEQIRAGNIPQGKAFQDPAVEVEEVSFDENRIELTAEEMKAIMGTSEEKSEVPNEDNTTDKEEIIEASTDGIDLGERVEFTPEKMDEILNANEKDSNPSVEEVQEHGQADPGIVVEDISIEEYEAAVAAQQAREAEANAIAEAAKESDNIEKEAVRDSIEKADIAQEEKPELTAEQLERIEQMEQYRDDKVEIGEIGEKADFNPAPTEGIDLEVVNVAGTEVEAINFNQEIEDIKRVIEDVTQQMEDQKDVEAANDPDVSVEQGVKSNSGMAR